MLARLALLALLTVPTAAAAQGTAETARKAPASPAAAPVVGCTSLANLRAVLRDTKGDTAAALAMIRDPRSDLGCSVLERGAVVEIADHAVLGGNAYDCLTLKGTTICHWIVAGAAAPAAPRPAARAKR